MTEIPDILSKAIKRAFTVLAPVAVLFTMSLPIQGIASAAPPASPDKSPDNKGQAKPKPKKANQGGQRGKKKIDLGDDFLVEGRLEKPNAFILFRRSAMEYDWARLDARFTPLVLESVQDPLF